MDYTCKIVAKCKERLLLWMSTRGFISNTLRCPYLFQKAPQLFLLNLAAACRLGKMEFNPYFNL